MKRLLSVGFGAVWASAALADQPVSVYPQPPEPRYIQIGGQEVPPPKSEPKAEAPAPAPVPAVPERMPQPLSVQPSVPTYPSYQGTNLPGTTVPMSHGPGYATGPALGCSTGTCAPSYAASYTNCQSCGVPCGTPLFSTGCRTGDRPCLDKFATWLGYRPGPRVLPVMIPNPIQHRPLHTYFEPTTQKVGCNTGSCATTPPPVFGFNLKGAVRPIGAALPNARPHHLGYNTSCETQACKPACGTPIWPQSCSTNWSTPSYLNRNSYPSAQYAPAPSMLSRLIGFFMPGCGTSPCSTGACGTTMGGSVSTWGTSACANGSCAASQYQYQAQPQVVHPATPMAPQTMPAPAPIPEKMPAPVPEKAPVGPQTMNVVPGYRFATPLTQVGTSPVQPVQHTVPAANMPFSKP